MDVHGLQRAEFVTFEKLWEALILPLSASAVKEMDSLRFPLRLYREFTENRIYNGALAFCQQKVTTI